jgi:hypothetical protein
VIGFAYLMIAIASAHYSFLLYHNCNESGGTKRFRIEIYIGDKQNKQTEM